MDGSDLLGKQALPPLFLVKAQREQIQKCCELAIRQQAGKCTLPPRAALVPCTVAPIRRSRAKFLSSFSTLLFVVYHKGLQMPTYNEKPVTGHPSTRAEEKDSGTFRAQRAHTRGCARGCETYTRRTKQMLKYEAQRCLSKFYLSLSVLSSELRADDSLCVSLFGDLALCCPNNCLAATCRVDFYRVNSVGCNL